MRRALTTLVATTTLAVLAAAPAGASSAGTTERPWFERTTGLTEITDCTSTDGVLITCPSELHYEITGTHVGRASLTAVGVATVDLTSTCVDDQGVTGIVAVNVTDEVIVASDGSTLSAHTEYRVCFVGDPQAFTGTRTITGGTGRFAGATGEMTLEGVNDSGPTEMTATGTITY